MSWDAEPLPASAFAQASSKRRDAVWLVLVLVLGVSLLAVLLPNEDASSTDDVSTLEPCPEGTEEVLNASAPNGVDCVSIDQHTTAHVHPEPTLSVTNVVDDGNLVILTGSVSHLHPAEVMVSMTLNGSPAGSTSPNGEGSWSLTVEPGGLGPFFLNLTASHGGDGTASATTTVEIDRSSGDAGAGNQTNNETNSGNESNGGDNGNGTSNGTGNQTSGGNETNGTGNSTGNGTGTGNQTDNGTGGPTDPVQPTYDPTDLGQFWLDVFRCQPGHNITQVDDLTTAAVETLECSVSITMNETHITIASNGLPDHDFESTLACSQANDCAAAQNYEWVIPRSPVNDTVGGHDSTNCPEANGDYECAAALGEVAIAINGVPFYGPEDGPGGDAVASHHGVYNEDRQPIELGVCHAHSGMGGTYHYHADANCLHWHAHEEQSILDYNISTPSAVSANTDNGSHSAVIGVSMDGYPVYGLWGFDENMSVVEMRSSYRLKAGETGYNGIDDYEYVAGLGDLDVCNGHFGPTPEFPDGIYHYHSTMLNGEGEMGFPYFLLCYHGETFLDEGDGGADCSGFGETWGPGIGPPPPGCENEGGGPPPGGQVSSVEPVSSLVYSPLVWVWMGALALVFLRRRG